MVQHHRMYLESNRTVYFIILIFFVGTDRYFLIEFNVFPNVLMERGKFQSFNIFEPYLTFGHISGCIKKRLIHLSVQSIHIYFTLYGHAHTTFYGNIFNYPTSEVIMMQSK